MLKFEYLQLIFPSALAPVSTSVQMLSPMEVSLESILKLNLINKEYHKSIQPDY